MNTDNLSPDDIQRLLASHASEPGDAELLERVRVRVAGELAGAAAITRPRRNWVPLIAAIAVPAAAAAALGGVLLFNLRPVATRTPVPTVESSPSPSPDASPVPTPSASAVPGAAVPISSLRMFPGGKGWATSSTDAASPGRILETSDGGVRWQTSHLPTAIDVRTVDFLDSEHAWVLGQPNATGLGPVTATVMSTNDAGQSWVKVGSVHLENPAFHVQFIDSSHGWITTGGGAAAGSNQVSLYRTVDGGINWTKVSDGSPGSTDTGPGHMPSGCDKNAPVFANAGDGYLTGSCAGGDPVFYASNDGGVTWTKGTLPLAGLTAGYVTNCQCDTSQPHFVSSTEGYLLLGGVVEAGPLNTLYVTHDAGHSWFGYMIPAHPAVDPAVDGAPYIKAITRPDNGNAAAPPDMLLASGDSGKNWHQVATPANILTATQVDFADQSNGWALVPIEATPTVWQTRDGGAAWTRLDYSVTP